MMYLEYVGIALLVLAVLYFFIRVGLIEAVFHILGAILSAVFGGGSSSSSGGFGGGSSGGGGSSDDY